MSEGFISRGFRGQRKPSDESGRLPPGQYLERGFPILSAGPTPHTSLANWDFSIVGEVDQPRRWSRDEFRALPRKTVTKDIHCVTKWSKFVLRRKDGFCHVVLNQGRNRNMFWWCLPNASVRLHRDMLKQLFPQRRSK